MKKRRNWLIVIMVVLSLFTTLKTSSMAQEYPTKPIILIGPHQAGGSSDLYLRLMAEVAKQHLGQPVIVEARPGGGGTVGPTYVFNSAPDGYTIGLMLRSSIVAYHMGKLTFNPLDGLTHIMHFGGAQLGFAVRSDSPWKTLREVIEYAKQNPGKVKYGSSGFGTTAHTPMEELAIVVGGIPWIHLPLQGDAGCLPALLGGHVDAISSAAGGYTSMVEAGKFRLLATYGSKRSKHFPDVLTLRDLGYNVVEDLPLEIVGPKGLPKPIVNKLDETFRKIMDNAGFQDIMNKFDNAIFYCNHEESEKFVRQDFERYRKIVQRIGMEKKQ